MEELLLGTYTRNQSKGIYKVLLDPLKKELSDVELVIEEENPTYLTNDTHLHLFSVSKVNNQGGIAAFNVDNEELKLANRVLDDHSPLCYISVDDERQLVFGANYHDGLLYVYKIQSDGTLTCTQIIERHGHGPHPNQKSSHVHYANLTPDKRLIVCDLGTDELILYDISNIGKLTEVATFKMPAGSGPRHLVFHPNNEYFYVFGELTSKIYLMHYDSDNRSFKLIDEISTFSDQHQADGGAAIRISSDGNFLYASNRSDSSISVFHIKDHGRKLQLIQNISSYGKTPRDFNLNKSEDFVIVGHQNSNNLTLFQRNQQTGLLSLIQTDLYAPEVVCILPTEN